ncbi:MAG: hypothetical protein IPK26_09320 [Planctomycetes bacterium]|nr:hypothetical protein [Planctomycetota bacterium]
MNTLSTSAHSRSINTCGVITTAVVPSFHRFFSEYATRPSGPLDLERLVQRLAP